jgi:hypothetical protein
MGNLLTPLTPWLLWSTVAAVVVGGAIGAMEAYCEYKLGPHGTVGPGLLPVKKRCPRIIAGVLRFADREG